jgi:hypothetical protein
MLRDLGSNVGLGSVIAALAPHDQTDMRGERLPRESAVRTRFLGWIWAFISNAN